MDMKLLLIDTGTKRKEYSEPIGIETLVSYVKNAEVRIMSVELQGLNSIVENIKTNKYGIIGISSKIGTFELVKKLILKIVQIDPNAIICIGDIYATYAYEEVLNWNKNIICLIGEGEHNLPDLVDIIKIYGEKYRKYLHKIKGIAYFDQGIKVTDRGQVFDVSDAMSPTRILLPEIIKKKGIAHLEGSRGCIYGKCSFCGIVQKYGQSYWRPFKEEYIYDELITLSDAGVVSPYFTDEDFFGNDVERVKRIANGIITLKKEKRINPELNFYFNMRVDSVVGNGSGGYENARRTLKLLKRAGLREVFIGVESGNSEQIERYHKNNEQQKSIRAIMTLNSLSIDIDIGFILFDPFMSIYDLLDNLNFIVQAGISTNYSRLAKKLRVEPLTPFAMTKKGSSNISNILDMETVSYPYTFIDKRVENVYKIFKKWESEDLDFIYNLQSFCRGEVPNEEERREAKNIISMYRSLDLAFLRKLAECELNNEKYDATLEHFYQIRDVYDKSLSEAIEYYMSTYRRGSYNYV